MKKIISLLLALIMVMGLSVTAFAENTETTLPKDSNATITAQYETGTAVYKSTYKVTVS